ncbi:family 20 glycosylhydrolase, partial [Akkermansia muciniphila]
MYTKQELKELVAYCAALGIEVIPEIDVPGHNQALAAAYPEFFCFPNPDTKVKTDEGVTLHLICPHKPEVWKFYAAVFKELKDIFPSGIVHLGGDEAPLEKTWAKCPLSIQYREQKGMKDVHEELKEFIKKMSSMLAGHGKRIQLWYEKPWARANIYNKGDTVFTWRMGLTPSTITETKKQGLSLIIAAGEHCYLDYPQLPGQSNRGWMPTTTLEQSYRLDPAYGRPEKETNHITGVQGTVWGEHLPTLNHILYRAYPRACAIAEAGWSPMSVRSWENFRRKLADHRQFILKRFNYDMERTKENEPPFK